MSGCAGPSPACSLAMSPLSQGRPGSSPWTCCSTSTQKSLPEEQTRQPAAALPRLPFPVVWAPRMPPALPGGILILTATPWPDLSVGRLPAKLEINFRSGSGFTWCNCLSAGNSIQFPESLGTEQTVQSNSFQSILTWAGDEPIWKRWEALQSSHLQFSLTCWFPTTGRSLLSQDHYEANSISFRSWPYVWFFR